MMKRRDFLKTVTAAAAGAAIPGPAIWSSAKADARSESLLIVSESGPNNLDIHGVGTNVLVMRCRGIAMTGSSPMK
jgi:peptide/nickel transport system substrate-binding protein